MKSLIVLVLLIASTLALIEDQCNPNNCGPSSTKCYQCSEREDPGCSENEDIAIGSCIEPVPIGQKKSSGQLHENRCRRLVDPDAQDVNFPASAFVKACRELEFTCNDGTCIPVKGIPKKCKKNVIGSSKCDPTDPNLQSTIQGLRKKHYKDEAAIERVCKDHGGVKYDYLHCNSAFLPPSQSGDICDENRKDRILTPVCGPVEGEKDKYIEECHEPVLTAKDEPCCLTPENEELNTPAGHCYPMIEAGPSYPDSGVSPTGGVDDKPSTGVVLTMSMSQSTDNCCCQSICECYGDPHCFSMFLAYELSIGNTGDYTFYEEDNLKIQSYLGIPYGVVEKVDLTLENTKGDINTYTFDADVCREQAELGKPIFDPLPEGWEFINGFQPRYRITNVATLTTTIIVCVQFEQKRGHKDMLGIHNRLDVKLLKNTNVIRQTGEDTVCCATDEEVFDFLDKKRANGFCMKRPTDSGFILPDGGEGEDPGRRLEDVDPKILKLCSKMEDPSRENESTCFNKESCIKQEVETDMGSCKPYWDYLQKNGGDGEVEFGDLGASAECGSVQSDYLYDPEADKCKKGISFQVYDTKKAKAKWETLYFFPEDKPFCYGSLHVLFNHAKVGNVPLDLSRFDIRLSRCSPPEECFLMCSPELEVDLSAQFTYPCTTSDTMSMLFVDALSKCSTCGSNEDMSTCMMECMGHGICECPV